MTSIRRLIPYLQRLGWANIQATRSLAQGQESVWSIIERDKPGGEWCTRATDFKAITKALMRQVKPSRNPENTLVGISREGQWCTRATDFKAISKALVRQVKPILNSLPETLQKP